MNIGLRHDAVISFNMHEKGTMPLLTDISITMK